MSDGVGNMKSLFEKKAQDSGKVQTNAKAATVKSWTPNSSGSGAHSRDGFASQTLATETGRPKKRSLADLP
eukprot:CAMPEP_0184335320 /NCGR_PEP_ID=MMETSP1089-20130417/3900_1 /TAXON_ID=38269 ORGANISM="Gloeochaete wittrockiana, Strain SAG46.84" /NCGR_SAMPLE_ID=MMETSP1089 /ASSEMBLY_ACC=CAM_ASM_000445 /LENGTH=70 /DNA_ID=CAMNT_0026659915 /DNA_START=88 /DNA_END=300 /DNA_ORIENTATION=+